MSSRSKLLEGLGEVPRDQRPDPLRLPVVGVVVAGGERVGAEHDPALDLVAEAGGAGVLVHRREVVGGDADAEADAVEAGQVGGGLGRREHVVGGDAVLGVRKVGLGDLCPERLAELERALEDLADAGLDPLGVAGELARDAEPEAVEALRGRHRDVGLEPGAGRVVRIGTLHRREHQGRVGDGPRQRAALVERGGEGDHPVARDRAVGRLQADDPAERRGLADRAARVGADRAGSRAAGDRRGRAARGAAGNAARDPRG